MDEDHEGCSVVAYCTYPLNYGIGPDQALLLNGDDPDDSSFASQLALDENKRTHERCTGTWSVRMLERNNFSAEQTG